MTSGLFDGAATVVVVAGLVAGAVVAVREHPLEGLRTLLDFLLGAGLLRLAGDPGWSGLAGAAAIVAIRQLVGRSLHLRRVGAMPADH